MKYKFKDNEYKEKLYSHIFENIDKKVLDYSYRYRNFSLIDKMLNNNPNRYRKDLYSEFYTLKCKDYYTEYEIKKMFYIVNKLIDWGALDCEG